LAMAARIWYMGVMPVPPANMPAHDLFDIPIQDSNSFRKKKCMHRKKQADTNAVCQVKHIRSVLSPMHEQRGWKILASLLDHDELARN
jgi:hypothetical protein